MSRRRVAAALLLLAVLTLAAFSPVLKADFVNYDDGDYVTSNPMVRAGLTMEGLRWAFTTFHASNWHPLTWLSHMLDVELFGMRPWGHHLTSVLIHLATAWLLFLFLAPATGAFGASLLAAALFAVHPLRVESVAWIAERKDLLAGLFFVLTLHAWRRYAARPSLARYLAAAFLFALGLLAKPMLVTLPFVLLLIDLWPLGRRPGIRLFLEKLPLLALSAASSIITMRAQSDAIADFGAFPFDHRLANALISPFAYLAKVLWPMNLAVFYPHPGDPLLAPLPFAAASALVLVTVGTLLILRRAPYLAVGWFWYIGMLVPVSGLIQVGSQGIADRYTYLPSIGLSLALIWGVGELVAPMIASPPRRRIVAVTAATVIIALTLLSRRQAGSWRDTETLFTHAVMATRGSRLAHTNLGAELLDRRDLQGAERHFREALRIEPEDPVAWLNLGDLSRILGDSEVALARYRKALELQPTALDAYLRLGETLMGLGRMEEAGGQFRRALEVDPAAARAHFGYGVFLMSAGDDAAALARFETTLAIDPLLADAHFNAGVLLARRGERDAAAGHYRKALSRDPGNLHYLNNLAAVEAEAGRLGEAASLLREAVRLHPDDPTATANLAEVTRRLAESGGESAR